MSDILEYSFLLAPGVPQTLERRGRFWRIRSISVAGGTVSISFNDNKTVIAKEGDRGEQAFSRLSLQAAVLTTAVFQVGDQPIISDAANVSIANVTAAFEENNGGASPLDVNIAAGGTAIISPARATKREVVIKNPIGNTGNFRIGTAPAADRGVEIEPGAGVTLSGSMAVSAYNAGSANEALTVTELDRL